MDLKYYHCISTKNITTLIEKKKISLNSSNIYSMRINFLEISKLKYYAEILNHCILFSYHT